MNKKALGDASVDEQNRCQNCGKIATQIWSLDGQRLCPTCYNKIRREERGEKRKIREASIVDLFTAKYARKVSAGAKIVLTGLLLDTDEHKKSLAEGMSEMGFGVPKVIGQFKTLAGQGGDGGRNDVVIEIEDDYVSKYATSAMHLSGGGSWADDYITNNKDIIPPEAMQYFKDIIPYETEDSASDDEYFTYLDELRESGETNMFGAASYLTEEFNLDRTKAREVLKKWMDTFKERNPKEIV